MDLVNLKRLIIKDKELDTRRFEVDEEEDEEDELDYEEEQLNAMIRSRFNRQIGG